MRRHFFRPLYRYGIDDKDAGHDQSRGDNQKQAEADSTAQRFDLGANRCK